MQGIFHKGDRGGGGSGLEAPLSVEEQDKGIQKLVHQFLILVGAFDGAPGE